MLTIQEAKTHLRENFDKGTGCPCCGQFVKRYRRSIYGTMARMLIAFYRLKHPGFMHVNDVIRLTGLADYRCGDWAKLVYWGLIEEKSKGKNEDKRTSGYWRITDRGKEFVEGALTVPKYIYLYNQKYMGNDGPEVHIRDCIGKKFSYEELMYH